MFATKTQHIKIKRKEEDQTHCKWQKVPPHITSHTVLSVDVTVFSPDCEQRDHRTSSLRYLHAQLSTVSSTGCWINDAVPLWTSERKYSAISWKGKESTHSHCLIFISFWNVFYLKKFKWLEERGGEEKEKEKMEKKRRKREKKVV